MRLAWVLRLALLGLVVAVVVAGYLRVQRLDRDTDADGIPDCTELAGLHSEGQVVGPTDPGLADTDGDQVPDGEEVRLVDDSWWSCRPGTVTALSDPAELDTDGDLLGDAYELSAGSDAFVGDTDSDGLSDGRERGWGSDPNAVDTDGDGIRDGDDVAYGLTPVFVDQRIEPDSWQTEFRDGLVKGDAAEVDSVPQLLGTMAGGAASGLPVIGWVAGGVADTRDAAANAIRGDWVAAGTSAAGLVPYAGDAARLSGLLGKFLVRYPDKVNAVAKAVAGLEQLPIWVRMKLLGVTDPAQLEKVRQVGLSDEQILKLAKRGTTPSQLAVGMARSAGKRAMSAAFADSEGFAGTFADAQAALRARAADVEGPNAVSAEPVYLVGLPGHLGGGRLIDVCSVCTPQPRPDMSRLRIVKVGTQLHSETLQCEIDKDAYLVEQGYSVEWHFFAGRTGLMVDEPLIEALGEAGVRYYLHFPA